MELDLGLLKHKMRKTAKSDFLIELANIPRWSSKNRKICWHRNLLHVSFHVSKAQVLTPITHGGRPVRTWALAAVAWVCIGIRREKARGNPYSSVRSRSWPLGIAHRAHHTRTSRSTESEFRNLKIRAKEIEMRALHSKSNQTAPISTFFARIFKF